MQRLEVSGVVRRMHRSLCFKEYEVSSSFEKSESDYSTIRCQSASHTVALASTKYGENFVFRRLNKNDS